MMKEYLILHTIALCSGIAADLIIPDPHFGSHPIRLIGNLIHTLEKVLYRPGTGKELMIRGAVLSVITVTVTGTVTALITICSYRFGTLVGVVAEAVLTYFILAAGSLRYEAMKVYSALGTEPEDAKEPDLNDAREALSMIVGRDTANHDEAGIIRAAVETVAENTSDGVVAPMLYTAVFGPVGGFAYKSVNTMDSMIGYHNERYEYFGKVAAKADDVLNYLPSRISALYMIAASYILSAAGRDHDAKRAYLVWVRDRRAHESPNSAQTESACAGSLGIRLGGPACYKGIRVDRSYIGDDTRPVEKNDIKKAVSLLYTISLITALSVTALLFIAWAMC